jgi:hypothetical protein
LFRTSEYIATGFFHNSQIIKVDHDSKKVTFRYKSWVDRNTGKKSYRVITMDIYQFIDKMLYFLPEPGRKMIRYYGIYAQSIRGSTGSPTKLELIRYTSWIQAIEHSFYAKPVNCPGCGEEMEHSVVYSGTVFREINKLRRTHDLQKGYFRLGKPP